MITFERVRVAEPAAWLLPTRQAAVLAAPAREEILDAVWLATQDRRVLEIGGLLYGTYRGGGVVVERAIVSCSDRTPTSAQLDLQGHTGFVDGLVPCGDWHLHPSGGTEPSPTDLRAWQASARVEERPWLGVIVGARRYQSEPTLAGFLAVDHDADPNAPWNYKYRMQDGIPSRLPGGWVRRTKRLRIGEDVWWEREREPGLIETYVGDVEPELVAA